MESSETSELPETDMDFPVIPKLENIEVEPEIPLKRSADATIINFTKKGCVIISMEEFEQEQKQKLQKMNINHHLNSSHKFQNFS